MKLNPALLTAGGTVAKTYVDDVFSAYTYTGTGSTQTITNGIDLAGKGGLVWLKDRTSANPAWIMDTVRGTASTLQPSSTNGAGSTSTAITAFNTNGFTIGSNGNSNTSNNNYVAWTFRKASKFFDVVTYTGNGSTQSINHSLGVAPGMIVVKRTDTGSQWFVYHRGCTSASYFMLLNTTDAESLNTGVWNATAPTSTVFSLGVSSNVNASGGTYVAYLFAHDTSADGLIQCGSFTATATVNLGWEPQFLLVKRTDSATQGDWAIYDNMRGFPAGANGPVLKPNSSAAEGGWYDLQPTATGFNSGSLNTGTYVYLAIRRPNKPPTTGTQVYNAVARTGTGAVATVTGVGFAPDLMIGKKRNGTTQPLAWDRLRGTGNVLITQSTAVESSSGSAVQVLSFGMDGVSLGTDSGFDQINGTSSDTFANWFFRRAPGVFDVVCDTGTGVAHTVAHGLGVVPELIIRKKRSAAGDAWMVYAASLGATKELMLNMTLGSQSDGAALWNSTAPTSSVFTVGTDGSVNANTATFVTYLFATLAGVSYVGSYTGNGGTAGTTGTSQNLNFGFSSGARFLLIKATNANSDWWVWDSIRGIVASTDPHLSLNTTAAEVTTDDSVDPYSQGVTVNQLAATDLNVTGRTYLVLAFA